MRRLIWKELREKRLWALLLFASVAGVVVFDDGYTFCGEEFGGWIAISFVAAFLLGGSSYSSELAGGRADFLYSRHISWKKVLLAKLLVGLGAVVVAVVASAVVYRLLCPVPLLPFATPTELAKGAAIAMGIMAIAYAVGFLCSIVLPGVFGSMLVTFAMAATIGITVYILAELDPYPNDAQGFGLFGGWVLGAIVATIVTARFGLTLSTVSRVGRYALITGLIGVVVGVAAFQTAGVAKLKLFDSSDRSYYSLSSSPDGRYSIVHYVNFGNPTPPDNTEVQLVRRVDDSRLVLTGHIVASPANRYEYGWVQQCYWVDNTNAVTLVKGVKKVEFVHIKDDGGPLTKAAVTVQATPCDVRSILVPSPDRKLAIMVSGSRMTEVWGVSMSNLWEKTGADGVHGRLVILDALTGRKLTEPIRSVRSFWWQSDTEVAYVKADGVRHIVKISDLKGLAQ